MVIIALIWFAAVLVWELRHALRRWKAGKDIKHKWQPVKRAAMLSPAIVLLTCASPAVWYFSLGAALLMVALAWWLLFDGIYNIRRGFNWWFNGSPEGKTDDSFLDKILRRIPDRAEKWLKIGALVVTVFFYVLVSIGYKLML